jgi:uncharacterized protein
LTRVARTAGIQLAGELPENCVPRRWNASATLPQNISGKGAIENNRRGGSPTVAYPLQRNRTALPRTARHLTNPDGSGWRNTVPKEDRGFASMDRARQREIASKGGKAAHEQGTAHEWSSEEAREAGRKGGMASHRRRREERAGGTDERGGPM